MFPLFLSSDSFSFLFVQVVMAVAQLYFHLAPKAEVGVIAKALVRLMRSHRLVVVHETLKSNLYTVVQLASEQSIFIK